MHWLNIDGISRKESIRSKIDAVVTQNFHADD